MLTELTNWLVLSVQRSVIKMITAKGPLHLLQLSLSLSLLRVAPHRASLCHIMRQINSYCMCCKHSRKCCNTPVRRLYCTPRKLYQYLHFLLLCSLSRYFSMQKRMSCFVYLRIFMSIYVDHVQTTRTIIITIIIIPIIIISYSSSNNYGATT